MAESRVLEKSPSIWSTWLPVCTPAYPAPKYVGTGGSTPISVRYFAAHWSAQPSATAQGMYAV